ncbi:MAG: RsmB/NOP family class I SAM-dependent RNA methyltransferase [Lachnospiraceae bacterium]|nr:RsmB/NOP family class I SAM-dependent RNA methyltransferase [Lachnospiraceae bacterium]
MLPIDFCARMKKMLGGEYDDFVKSYDRERFHALRVNPLKEGEDFLSKNVFNLSPVAWCPNGYYYDAQEQPGKSPYHEAGVYYIQEPSAMAPVEYLGVNKGERILDLCAAPGGKTTQIAAAMGGEGLLVANEINPSRAKILSLNIERMGVTNCLVTSETPQKLAEVFEGYFDRILVDAPCSGEGMFIKNDTATGEWSLENVQMCADRQDEILECAARMLASGGRIVFSTCTFAPSEDEGSVSRFIEKYPDFHIADIAKFEGMDAGRPEWVDNPAEGLEKTIRLWPHHLKGEGHYLAVLDRDGDLSASKIRVSRNGLAPSAGKNDTAVYKEFEKDTLNFEISSGFFKFGEQLYKMPDAMPGIDHMKVLRPGLHLGTIKKNRFEPSHALALTLTKDKVKRCVDLGIDSARIKQFLTGQTLNIASPKGWTLITVDGYAVGWGKSDGRIIKNHYPKGLRIMGGVL